MASLAGRLLISSPEESVGDQDTPLHMGASHYCLTSEQTTTVRRQRTGLYRLCSLVRGRPPPIAASVAPPLPVRKACRALNNREK